MIYRAASDFNQWRVQARPLLQARVPADRVVWNDSMVGAVLADAPIPAPTTEQSSSVLTLPRVLMQLLETLSYHRQAGRWELMYRLAWRTVVENPRLLEDAADPDVHAAELMERAIRRDCHKMHAFVRFREFNDKAGDPAYFAWFEPEHPIVRLGAKFFVERFANMHWTIATPDGTAIWEHGVLSFVDAPAAEKPDSDAFEDLWRLYYRSICNVARINPTAMRREMPQKYWKHLPEAQDIGVLVRDGLAVFSKSQREDEDEVVMPKAVERALAKKPADSPAPADGATQCRRCGLWEHATQAVLGEGPTSARVMLVGEQPGDKEDLQGAPFVGPAGKVLDAALASSGLDREQLYVTNAVKHFKWEPRGKHRLHKKPNVGEISACTIWLEQEIQTVKPAVIVALGATALRALTGRTLSIEAARSEQLQHGLHIPIVATYHPSAILRADDRAEVLRAMLIADLQRAAALSEERNGT